jgi:gas vesicle protein
MQKLQETMNQSAARLDNFINGYTTKIQNVSHDVALFENTFQNRTAQVYDKITMASNKAFADFRNSIDPTIQNIISEIREHTDSMLLTAKENFTAFSQDRIGEADNIYDDLVEQAVSTIYDTTQEVLDQITEHHDQIVKPTEPQPTVTIPANSSRVQTSTSGDTRNHPTTPTTNTGRFPTPWS